MEIVAAVVGEVLKKVGSLSAQEIGAVWGIKSDLKKLETKFSMIQAALADAERRQAEEELVKRWLKRLKQVAYDTEDVLDDFAAEVLRRRMEMDTRIKSKVRIFFSLSNPFAFRVKMAHKIRDINQTLVQIEKDKVMFKFNEITTLPATLYHTGERKTSSHDFNASQIVGRKAEQMEILNLLINSNADNQNDVVPVIPIVGIGGLGKTTLAQIVYNDKSVEKFFDTRIWVCVSEVFDVEKILREIIESITRMKCDFSNTDGIVSTLQENLREKRFLLVLDDVWNNESDKWETFRSRLGAGLQGSKIIVTTRSSEVASIVGTLPTHHLRTLSKNDCWLLFKHWAFKAGGAEETSRFVEIGMDIVRKCGGVPLALIHVGSLMHSKTDEHEWLRLRDSEIWVLPENQKIIGILKLSYNNLSSSLKQCFSYCAMFCKGQVIDKKVLIQLWMAEGFLEPPQRSTQLMEDVGGEHLNILIENSFFQDVQMDEFEFTFKMHDLVHDLARSIVGDEWCIENVERLEYVSEIRRLSSVSDCPESSEKTHKLRTFMLQETMPRDSIEMFSSRLLRLKYLRVLDLHGTDIKEVPSSVRKLRHLRYIDLSGTPIEALPDDVCRLYNLQTLRLINCRKLRALPNEMRKLINLRHVECEGSDLSMVPRDIGKLSCLQTLPYFKVGKEGSGCSMREIQGLNLGGYLQIYMLENIANGREAKKANLENKSNIHTLELVWYWKDEIRGYDIPESVDSAAADDVIEDLKPHSNLKKLRIAGFVGVKIPTWLNVGFLPNLVHVVLRKWRCEHLPPLGQLPCLKVLLIKDMDGLRCIGDEFYGYNDNNGQGRPETGDVVFRSLRQLYLFDMLNLEEWVEPNGCCVFPLLQDLWINSCPNLTKTPTLFPSLTKLIIHNSSKSLLQSVSSKASSLTELYMVNITDMTCLPQGLLQKNSLLQKLSIWECSQLGALPTEELPHLKSLQSLWLRRCTSLSCVPDLGCLPSLCYLQMVATLKGGIKSLPEWLPCLRLVSELRFGGFGDEVDVFPLEGIQHMLSLRCLDLYGGPNIKSLPQQLRQLTWLEELGIYDFEGVEALPDWLTHLSSLQTLKIQNCTNLKHLPQGMHQVTKLQIIDCPVLEERCQMEKGDEWPKIAHIPCVIYKL